MQLEKHIPVNLAEKIDYKKGEISKSVIFQTEKTTMILMALEKDLVLSKHKVSSNVLINILEGEVDVLIDDNISHLEKGMQLFIEPNKFHTLTAVKSFKMLLVRFE